MERRGVVRRGEGWDGEGRGALVSRSQTTTSPPFYMMMSRSSNKNGGQKAVGYARL